MLYKLNGKVECSELGKRGGITSHQLTFHFCPIIFCTHKPEPSLVQRPSVDICLTWWCFFLRKNLNFRLEPISTLHIISSGTCAPLERAQQFVDHLINKHSAAPAAELSGKCRKVVDEWDPKNLIRDWILRLPVRRESFWLIRSYKKVFEHGKSMLSGSFALSLWKLLRGWWVGRISFSNLPPAAAVLSCRDKVRRLIRMNFHFFLVQDEN